MPLHPPGGKNIYIKQLFLQHRISENGGNPLFLSQGNAGILFHLPGAFKKPAEYKISR
jgi:hypothetical protein